MISAPPATERDFVEKRLHSDLAVIGGGMAGVCCAITAARAGIRVTLVQDRPVLGGNASSEVRMWMVGATAHMHNNNRWAREGGVIDEILVENMYRNPEGNPVIFDALLLDKIVEEPGITLLLNTTVIEVEKAGADTIESVRAYCSQNQTMYQISAPLFCDASGDGVVGFLAGAAFRMGAESRDEFGEKYAPDETYGHLLGHTIFFYSKDAGKPVRFVPPSFALHDITKIKRHHLLHAKLHGNHLWWLEYGGRFDTVHDTEEIKWELWRVVYGVWDHIKNSGEFPESETLTLEWVGQIPGKRESRRFEGPYILRQQDIVEQHHHDDAISYGGWALDLHPADGVFSERPGCDQWHARGVYQIPYRCIYSRNVKNLFLAGRIISASHVAFSSTRVMATLAHTAQAAGMAAAICARQGLLPGNLTGSAHLRQLQRNLMRAGQYIPGFKLEDPDDLAQQATVTATSRLRLAKLPPDGPLISLHHSRAQLLPVQAGPMPAVTLVVEADESTTLQVELRGGNDRSGNFTPGIVLGAQALSLDAGQQAVQLRFDVTFERPQYVFLCLMANERVSVRCSRQRLTGLVAVVHKSDQAPTDDVDVEDSPDVWVKSKQVSLDNIGVETFEFWLPERRPEGHNFALEASPPIDVYAPGNVINGIDRPVFGPNAWVADFEDSAPALTLQWEQPRVVKRIELVFDTDRDHAMEHLLMGHPETVIPFCVTQYRIKDSSGHVLVVCADNHQTRNTWLLDAPVETSCLVVEVLESGGDIPAALFAVRCYGTTN